jgi:hypothetical protein
MILVDRHQLEGDALNDPKHPLHNFAKEYEDTMKFLKERYNKDGVIRFKKIGYPKYTKGADSNFRELPKVKEPDTQWRIPLKAYVAIGNLGKHTWMCCLDPPDVTANGLYDMPKLSKRKGISIDSTLVVNIADQPDLAFFLYKISPFMERLNHNGLFRIIDPIKDDEEIGAEEMTLTRRKYAVWSMLPDVNMLKMRARAYGIEGVDEKQPNAIRKELEELLLRNDEAQKNNPAIKGTKEFEEEMQVTDSLLLRNFIQKAKDDKKIEIRADGRWHIGEKIIIQVPVGEMSRAKDYLCQYLMTGSNFDKLQEFIKDLISKEYLDAIQDGKKEWEWLAKIAEFNPSFKKINEIKEVTTKFFCPIL